MPIRNFYAGIWDDEMIPRFLILEKKEKERIQGFFFFNEILCKFYLVSMNVEREEKGWALLSGSAFCMLLAHRDRYRSPMSLVLRDYS